VAGYPDTDAQRLLVLGAGPAQLGLLRAAHERGLFTIAVYRDPAAPGFRYASRRAIFSNEDEVAIERLANAERVDGIIAPGTDWQVAIAARVAERLGLPHAISPATGVLATSKLRQRERFEEAGVPQPRWRIVNDADGEFGFPCVVKAPDRQGQKGLAYVREPAELADAVERARVASRSGLAMVEELVPGPEVTVNAFSVGGRFVPLTVTDRHVAEPPAFGVALAHVWEDRPYDAAVVDAARRAAEAVGIEDGPSYTQIRVGPDGPQVIELAARLGGGHDAELCEAAIGVDLNGLALAAALGEELPEIRPEPRVGAACVLFLVPPPGVLEDVVGVEEAKAEEGVLNVLVYRAPGHVFGPLRRGSDRAGAILAVGDSSEQALERARRAAERIRFETADAQALLSET
jgi:biotin carboxylase